VRVYDILIWVRFNFVLISGEGHTIILCESGEVFTFGKGDEGQLGQGNKWKSCRVPRKITSLEHETIVSIAAGARTSYAVTASGRVYNW
jgi:RCC1 and BTB domain-containing protein